MIRRRRPAPKGDTGASIVPLSRARGRGEFDDTNTGATALELRDGASTGSGSRSRFGELTPRASTATPRPNAPRAPARARRAGSSRELHDGWTFVLIPPGAEARPRTLRISVRRLRFVVVSLSVIFGSTALTGGLLVLALSILPPAQDEVRGVELGVFAAAAGDIMHDSGSTPAGLAAASAGATAPRATAGARSPATRRVGNEPRPGSGSAVSPSIMESLPVVGEITSRFARARRHPLLGVVRKHAGIDIAAPAGTQITAPAPGRVKFSGKKFGYGYTVELDHGNGVVTRYAHCRSLMVRAGDEVTDGAVIATVGRSGLATAPHLHYELLVRGRSVDPLRNPLASVLEGKVPPPVPATPQPADSALREPAKPDTIAVPEMEMQDVPYSDGAVVSPPVVTPSPASVVAGPVPSAIATPQAAVRDTVRKS